MSRIDTMSLLLLIAAIFGLYIAMRYVQNHEKLVGELKTMNTLKVVEARNQSLDVAKPLSSVPADYDAGSIATDIRNILLKTLSIIGSAIPKTYAA